MTESFVTIMEVAPEIAQQFVEESDRDFDQLRGDGLIGTFAALSGIDAENVVRNEHKLAFPDSYMIDGMLVCSMDGDRLRANVLGHSGSAPFEESRRRLLEVAQRLGGLTGRGVILSATPAKH
jgi:hypothetical protein